MNTERKALLTVTAGLAALLLVAATGPTSLNRFIEWRYNPNQLAPWICTNTTTGEGHWGTNISVRDVQIISANDSTWRIRSDFSDNLWFTNSGIGVPLHFDVANNGIVRLAESVFQSVSIPTNTHVHALVVTNAMVAGSAFVKPIAGMSGATAIGLPWRLFVMTNAVTVTNTTGAASLITNSLWGTNWIPGNLLTPGTSVRVRAVGYMTSASATPTTFGIRYGSGTYAATNVLALPTTLVNDFWTLEATLTVRATGAAGSIFTGGYIQYAASTGGASAFGTRRLQAGNTASAVTVNTTAPVLVDVFTIPGATTHGITLTACLAEVIP